MQELVLIGIHVDPDDVVIELDALVDVHTAVKQHWNTDNILIMGDLNADCTYISPPQLNNIKLREDPPFTWLIGDDADTTTSPNTNCAYDRCAGYLHTPNISCQALLLVHTVSQKVSPLMFDNNSNW